MCITIQGNDTIYCDTIVSDSVSSEHQGVIHWYVMICWMYFLLEQS